MSKGERPPKKHHYITSSYLSNFKNEKGKVYVFNHTNGDQWQSLPNSIAFEKDFHTVETVDGIDYTTFEAAFCEIEGRAKQIINRIIESPYQIPAPGTEDYDYLINFIALLSERTPSRRKHFSESISEVFLRMIQVGLNHEDHFEVQKKLIEEKYDEKLNLTYEQFNDYINSDNLKIGFHNNFHMESLMSRIDIILEPLAQRRWSVCIAPSEYGDFICSDNPVCLRNIVPIKGIFASPGHGVTNTEVSIPLSPRVMLLGRFEKDLPQVGFAPNSTFIAQMNSLTAMYSERYIFSKEPDFLWFDDKGQVSHIEDFKKRLQSEENKVLD